MIFEETSKNLKKDGHPEGCICEQFGYLPNLVLYPNSSDMNELNEIMAEGLFDRKEWLKNTQKNGR